MTPKPYRQTTRPNRNYESILLMAHGSRHKPITTQSRWGRKSDARTTVPCRCGWQNAHPRPATPKQSPKPPSLRSQTTARQWMRQSGPASFGQADPRLTTNWDQKVNKTPAAWPPEYPAPPCQCQSIPCCAVQSPPAIWNPTMGHVVSPNRMPCLPRPQLNKQRFRRISPWRISCFGATIATRI